LDAIQKAMIRPTTRFADKEYSVKQRFDVIPVKSELFHGEKIRRAKNNSLNGIMTNGDSTI